MNVLTLPRAKYLISPTSVKFTYCKSHWMKASAKCPKCKCDVCVCAVSMQFTFFVFLRPENQNICTGVARIANAAHTHRLLRLTYLFIVLPWDKRRTFKGEFPDNETRFSWRTKLIWAEKNKRATSTWIWETKRELHRTHCVAGLKSAEPDYAEHAFKPNLPWVWPDTQILRQ